MIKIKQSKFASECESFNVFDVSFGEKTLPAVRTSRMRLCFVYILGLKSREIAVRVLNKNQKILAQIRGWQLDSVQLGMGHAM